MNDDDCNCAVQDLYTTHTLKKHTTRASKLHRISSLYSLTISLVLLSPSLNPRLFDGVYSYLMGSIHLGEQGKEHLRTTINYPLFRRSRQWVQQEQVRGERERLNLPIRCRFLQPGHSMRTIPFS